jgi:hypothetical protein
MRSSENEARMISYLLGELPEAESVQIEEQYLADEEALASLLAVEAELYDAYARDDMSPERQRRFEERFLATAAQRQRLVFSRALLQYPRRPQDAKGIQASRSRRFLPALAVAALLIVGVGLWKLASVKQPPPVTPITVERTPIVIPFALDAGLVRQGGNESTLDIPLNADSIRLTLQLEQDSRPPFEAKLSTPEGVEIWTSEPARAPELAGPRSVTLEIPAGLLARGHYILTLSAANANGALESIADHAFLVRRP